MRIFISSPSDVATEKKLAYSLLNKLAARYSHLEPFEIFISDYHPSLAIPVPIQAQLPNPKHFDLVVIIYWRQMGTPLPAPPENPEDETIAALKGPNGEIGLTGTEYEYAWAREGWRTDNRPQLLVYRKTAHIDRIQPSTPVLERLIGDLTRVEAFDRNFRTEQGEYISSRHEFDTHEHFTELLENHAHKLIQQHLLSIGVPAKSLAKHAPSPTWHDRCPFRGLNRFESHHAELFFGRNRLVQSILKKMAQRFHQGQNLLLLIGASGSGKSSLIRAAIIPALTNDANRLAIFSTTRCHTALASLEDATPHDKTIETAISNTLTSATSQPSPHNSQTEARIADNSREISVSTLNCPNEPYLNTPTAHVRTTPQGTPPQPSPIELNGLEKHFSHEGILILVIDQFEQLYTGRTEFALRQRCHAILHKLTQQRNAFVLITLRSDYFSHFQLENPLVTVKGDDGQIDILPPSVVELAEIIQESCKAGDITLQCDNDESDLIDSLLKDTSGSSAALPLIAFTMQQLYIEDCLARKDPDSVAVDLDQPHSRRSSIIKFSTYTKHKGVRGVMEAMATSFDRSLSPDEQKQLHLLFWRLINTPQRGQPATARTAIFSINAVKGTLDTVISRLASLRLLTVASVTDEEHTHIVVKLAHEVLIECWPSLKSWIRENDDLLEVSERLHIDADQWLKSNKSKDFLLSSGRAIQEAKRLKLQNPDLTPSVVQYIDASITNLSRLSRRSLATRITIYGLSLIAVFASCGLVFQFSASTQEADARKRLLSEYDITVSNSAEGGLAARGGNRTFERVSADTWPMVVTLLLSCKNLSSIALDHIELETLPNLDKLKDLREVRLNSFSELSDLDLSVFSDMRVIEIKNCISLERVSFPKAMKTLHTVVLSNCSKLSGSLDFSSAWQLTALDVTFCENLSTVTLPNQSQLTQLDVDFCRAFSSSEDLTFLTQHPFLRSLSIAYQPYVTLNGIESCPDLELIDLSFCDRLQNIRDLELLPALSVVQLSGALEIDDFSPLTRLSNLREVRLSEEQLKTHTVVISELAMHGIVVTSQMAPKKVLPPWESHEKPPSHAP